MMNTSWRTNLCAGVVAAGAGLTATHNPTLMAWGAGLASIGTALGFFFAADHANLPTPPTSVPDPEGERPFPPNRIAAARSMAALAIVALLGVLFLPSGCATNSAPSGGQNQNLTLAKDAIAGVQVVGFTAYQGFVAYATQTGKTNDLPLALTAYNDLTAACNLANNFAPVFFSTNASYSAFLSALTAPGDFQLALTNALQTFAALRAK